MSTIRSSLEIPRQASLLEVIEAKSGLPYSDDGFHAKTQNERQLRTRIAREHQKRGQVKKVTNRITRVGLLTGHGEDVENNLPRRRLYPWVLRSVLQPLRNSLWYFLEKEWSRCRLFTVTVGNRTALNEVSSRLRVLADRVRRLNDRIWFNDELQVVFRSSEITFRENTFHTHGHIIIRAKHCLSKVEWVQLTARLKDHFGGVVHDCNWVRSPSGLSHYVTKPNKLEDLCSDDWYHLGESVKYIRTHECLGEFRKFCADLKNKNLKVIRMHGGFVTLDRSEGNRRTTKRRNGKPGQKATDPAPHCKKKTKPVNRPLKIGPPIPLNGEFYEPTMLVDGFTCFADLNAQQPCVRKIRERFLAKLPEHIARKYSSQIQSTSDRLSTDKPAQPSAASVLDDLPPDDSSFPLHLSAFLELDDMPVDEPEHEY